MERRTPTSGRSSESTARESTTNRRIQTTPSRHLPEISSAFSTPSRVPSTNSSIFSSRGGTSNAEGSLTTRFGAVSLEDRLSPLRQRPLRLSETTLQDSPLANERGFHERIGRLQQQIDHKDAEIRQLHAEKQDFRAANEQMLQEVSRITSKLNKMQIERNNLRQKVEDLSCEKQEQDAVLRKTNDQLSKAQTTIKVQSAQIAQPREVANPNSALVPTSKPRTFNITGHTPPPLHGPPAAPNFSFSTSLSMSRQLSFEMAPTYLNSSMVTNPTGTDHINLTAEFSPFFQLTEHWAFTYCNIPDKHRDDCIPDTVQAQLKQFTNPDIYRRLLAKTGSRYLTVAKVINMQVTNFAFRPLILKGFSTYYDDKISMFRAQLGGNLPVHIRRGLLQASADTVQEMGAKSGYRDHAGNQLSYQLYQMWKNLEPLLNPGVPDREAYASLKNIWDEGARIGFLMMSKASTFHLDYPAIGPNAAFNPSTMFNRDPDYPQDPQTLNKKGATVRLAITPHVQEVDFMGSAANTKTLHLSNVLISL